MPNMNGYDATRAIRALDREDAKTVPVLAMTANAYKEDIDRALESGMNSHLAKPINIDDVMAALRKYLGG
jgi:CheY-like chemotaxis protein